MGGTPPKNMGGEPPRGIVGSWGVPSDGFGGVKGRGRGRGANGTAPPNPPAPPKEGTFHPRPAPAGGRMGAGYGPSAGHLVVGHDPAQRPREPPKLGRDPPEKRPLWEGLPRPLPDPKMAALAQIPLVLPQNSSGLGHVTPLEPTCGVTPLFSSKITSFHPKMPFLELFPPFSTPP
ncbi:hypothetical protein Q9966_016637 [Columba livia]|nr:hypothetical protein Q9966_016637 [Columba livia]